MKCYSCGKELSPPDLDESEDGLEGYIARNLPEPDRVFCNDICLEKGKPQ